MGWFDLWYSNALCLDHVTEQWFRAYILRTTCGTPWYLVSSCWWGRVLTSIFSLVSLWRKRMPRTNSQRILKICEVATFSIIHWGGSSCSTIAPILSRTERWDTEIWAKWKQRKAKKRNNKKLKTRSRDPYCGKDDGWWYVVSKNAKNSFIKLPLFFEMD